MRVGVTGATGFIGRHLVKSLLERGDDVRILTRRAPGDPQLPAAVAAYQANLAHSDASKTLASFADGLDVLYHAAGELRNKDHMHALHVEGAKRLLNASAGKIGRWVQLSSVGVYGPTAKGIVTEDTALNPVGPYECTKVQSDLLLEQRVEQSVFAHAIVRPSNVIGLGMTSQSIFDLIGMIHRRLFFFIGQPGASANYVSVENVVDALMLSGTHACASGRTYIVSEHRTMELFVQCIADALGAPRPFLRLPESPIRAASRLLSPLPFVPLTEARVDALVGRAVYCTQRIERELGYSPRLSLEQALQSLVREWKRK